MPYTTVFYNGEFQEYNDVSLPIEERGFQFGDGIYEVVRLYRGHFYLFDEHVERLYRSASEIGLEIPWDKRELKDLLNKLVKRNNCTEDAILYLQITRGSFPRSHEFPIESKPNTVAYVKALPRPVKQIEEGVNVTLVPDVRWLRCDIKSLNLLPNVLAKQAATEKEYFEAILHRDGIVTEGSSSNVFIVKDNRIYTHPATNLILNGMTRMRIFDFCQKLDIEFVETPFTNEEVFDADECFLASTTSEVMPIVKVDSVDIINKTNSMIVKKLVQAFTEDIDNLLK